MPLPEEYKKDWDSRDLLGIDPNIDITTKVAVKNNSPSDLLIGVLLANTELNIVPVGNKIGYGTTYDATDKAMSSGITEKLARELYTGNVTKTIQKVFARELPLGLEITQNYYDALALNALKTGYAIFTLTNKITYSCIKEILNDDSYGLADKLANNKLLTGLGMNAGMIAALGRYSPKLNVDNKRINALNRLTRNLQNPRVTSDEKTQIATAYFKELGEFPNEGLTVVERKKAITLVEKTTSLFNGPTSRTPTVRNNNPGGMWPASLTGAATWQDQFGALGYETVNTNDEKLVRFQTLEGGMAALFYLLRVSDHFNSKPWSEALTIYKSSTSIAGLLKSLEAESIDTTETVLTTLADRSKSIIVGAVLAKWEAETYHGGPNPGTIRQWGEAWDWANTVITA
jgi:hypothetical protein